MSPAAVKRLEGAALFAALLTIPLIVFEEQGHSELPIQIADWLIWAVFAVELVGTWTVMSARARVFHAAVVVISFPLLPSMLGLVRLARVARLIRLVGVASKAFAELGLIFGRRGVLYVASVTALLIVAGGGALSVLEQDTVKGGFGNGVWWAIVTASTVGYGDIAPSTLPGRLIAIILMLTGIGLVSTLAASITTYFLQAEEKQEFRELSERLERIEAQLRRIQPRS